MSGFQFSHYTLRPAEEADRAHLAGFIAADAEHRDSVQPDFFLKPERGEECFLLLDNFGEPVFYFKMERALRIHIQFGPCASDEQRERNRTALKLGMAWLEQMAARSGHRQLIFESKFAPLIAFCKRRLGFRQSKDELVRNVAPEKACDSSNDVSMRGCGAAAKPNAPAPKNTAFEAGA